MKRILTALLTLPLLCSAAGVQLTGETNRPENSFFRPGETVLLNFEASGLAPGRPETLLVEIFDHHDRRIRKLSVPVQAQPDGTWRGSVPAPDAAYGFYRARVKLSSGVTTPKTGSRPAGEITYAVLPDPAARRVYPLAETFFGLHGQSAGMVRWIGGRWMGVGVVMEEKKGAELAARYRKEGWVSYRYATLATPFRYHYLSAEDVKKHTNGKIFTDAAGEALFLAFYRELASRGKNQKYGNDVMRYQPMWEPDLTFTDEEILNLHRVAHAGIRAGDPEAKILGPCFSNITRESLARHRKLFEMGLLRYIDELTIHPYIQYPVEQNGFAENVRRLRELVRRYSGGREIPIRANESGYKASATVEQELVQMYGQVRANLIMLGEGFASNEPFYGYDHGDGGGDYGLCYNLTLPARRWAPPRVAPRPAFAALAAASFLLEGHRPTGRIGYLGDTVLGYSYADRSGHCVIALWDFGGHEPEVELPVGRAEIEVADMMGNRKRVAADGGMLRLKLSGTPVYVLGASPGLWGRSAVKRILPDRDSLEATAGGSVTLSGRCIEQGELRLIFPRSMKRGALTAKTGPDGRFSFSAVLPPGMKNGKYPLTLELRKDGKFRAAAGVLLEVLAPVRVADISPAFENGEPALRLKLANPTAGETSGMLETRISGYPEARKRVAFSLPAGKETELFIPFEGMEISPFRTVEAEVKIRPRSGGVFETRAAMNFLSAAYQPGAGAGGDFGAWKKKVFHPVDPAPVRSPHLHAGDTDLSAKIAFGWNESFLLFEVEAVDDVFLQPYSGWRIWDGDALQFGFAKKRAAQENANEFGILSELAFSEINFALTAKGAEADRTVSYDKERFPLGSVSSSELPRSIAVSRRPDGKSLIRYRIAVPWRFLNVNEPHPGMTVCWAGMVNDRDEAKQSDVSALGIFQLKQAPPKHFGMIFLSR